ncbi:CHAT domain-containing protein [Aquiflexum gelatinilyticum]|uniref:CHAT domain-containing protein n=1 Tax=Aquiflexum gelatinilyticum TaxID=2961943 RepID=UPI002167B191|nr:CHAT domain-containing protein [Aquiflexum gelatinilyticum]MCS4435752.1 CHAT domain-containing protein [Aquiflexum gelatinilyticum]
MNLNRNLFFLIVFAFSIPESFGQVGQKGLEWIDWALEEKNYLQADSALKAQIKSIYQEGLIDSLPLYTSYIGRVETEKSGQKNGIAKVQKFISDFLSQKQSTKLNIQIHREAAGFYEYIGELELAYQANQSAFDWGQKDPEITFKELGKIQNNMATLSLYLGNRVQAKVHVHKAISLYHQEPKLDAESLYLSYNALGNIHWFGARMDSAKYFYLEALKQFESMEDTPRNKHYRPAMVLNNLSAVQSALGKSSASILSLEQTIDHLTSYIKAMTDVQEINKGKEFQYQAIDNLAGKHKELGNYSRAKDLLEYAYEQKKASFGPESPEVFKSQILLGQLYYDILEFELAENFLLEGLALIDKLGGEYFFWQADAYYALARIKDVQEENEDALHFYQLADRVFQTFTEGEFDDIYLGFLTNSSLFYAETGLAREAKTTAKRGLDYVIQNQGKNSLLAFNQILNLADIHYLLHEYQESLRLSDEALQVIDGRYDSQMTWLDSIQTETKKSRAILIQVKSAYQLEPSKDEYFLLNQKSKMDKAILILERRKTAIGTEEDLNLLLSENRDLFDFSKKIDLELHELTGNEKYLDDFLSKHESSIYNKVRARLQKVDNIKFADIPDEIQEKESFLKTNLQQALNQESPGISPFLKANQEWEEYLGMLKTTYPAYFQFRYGNILSSIDDIRKNIPAKTTVVRYIFVGENLAAVVMDQNQKRLVALDFAPVQNHIQELQANWNNEEVIFQILEELHSALWKPLESYIQSPKLIIIPDGQLFNLSFEILTPQKISAYSEFATKSLLAKHSISYHYSSLLIQKPKPETGFKSNFVAFAPGFFDKMKSEYLSSLKDSLYMDKAYLTLIPQPFTLALVKKVKSLFGGSLFVEDESTVSRFKETAGMNRIIHIGTHAESNNLSPAYSKLIFSKEAKEESFPEENSLYAFDIYNIDLRAKLAVLTACETGKNTFDPGEGMVSLAHAFNYAGSESLLIGLWQIDEKASSIIVEEFYKNLSEGLDKAEALQKAKLNYLSISKGRELSPDFWAGLILMGDPSPLVFEKSIGKWWYLMVFVALGLLLIGWRKYGKENMK